MIRRDFIRTTAIAGATGAIAQGCSVAGKTVKNDGPGFDVHPFVKEHPEAVFIQTTDVASKRDTGAFKSAGSKLAKEIIVPVPKGGYPMSTRITIKPNWTCSGPKDGHPVYEKLGVNTDPNYVEGFVGAMKGVVPSKYYIRECACPNAWEDMGWTAMAERAGIDFRDLSSLDYWKLGKDDINFVDIDDGVVFKKKGFMAPMNEDDTFLLNIAKLKAHGMGITASIKNLQGINGRRFSNFCGSYDKIRGQYGKKYSKFMHRNFEKHIEELYAKHLKDGIPRWDRPGPQGGIWQEQWCQRMLDSLSVTPTGINIVEGIYSQDGNGFGSGPHEKQGKYGVTSRDYMSNVVIFCMDPFRVDNIAHWLAGHEPCNFGLFHIGIERGMSDVLDPHDIPIYNWKDGRASMAKLDSFDRTPLVTYYLQRDYNGQNEPKFHMCDERFDYASWKRGTRVADCTPSIRQIGSDNDKNVVMELNLPKKDDVYVDVVDKKGDLLWRLYADDLEPGVHQVCWDGFSSPGIYNVYVKGMGWDAKNQVVTLS